MIPLILLLLAETALIGYAATSDAKPVKPEPVEPPPEEENKVAKVLDITPDAVKPSAPEASIVPDDPPNPSE